jgi:hypothetical protein
MPTSSLAQACAQMNACLNFLAEAGINAVIQYSPLEEGKVELISGLLSAHASMHLHSAFQELTDSILRIPRVAITDIRFKLHLEQNNAAIEISFCQKYTWITGPSDDAVKGLYGALNTFRERMVWIDQTSNSYDEINLYVIKTSEENGTRTHHQVHASTPGEAVRLLSSLRRQHGNPQAILASVYSVLQNLPESLWAPDSPQAEADTSSVIAFPSASRKTPQGENA